MALKRAFCCRDSRKVDLTSESVEGTALSLQCIDDIHGCDGLPLGVFCVSNSVPDNVLQENLQNSSGFLVDEARYTLHTTTSCQSSDGGLGYTLDVVPKYFSVTLGAPFAQTFTSFTTSRHFVSKL